MNLTRFTISIFLVALGSSLSLANNTYFLPGDAYFYIRLDLESAQQLTNSKSPILQYGSHWNGGYGCGQIGYQKIELTNMSADTKSAIVDTYRKFEKTVNDDPNLSGGQISVFVYSDEYDWGKFGLGLQYNENWVDESVAFGVSRDHVRLESFVTKPNSIMQNWRDSTLIAPLPAVCPTLPNGHKQAWTKTPVKIDLAKCKIVILPNRDFDSYVTPTNGLQLIEISDGKLTRFERTNGEWKPQ